MTAAPERNDMTKRMTLQKAFIFDAVQKLKNHPTADDVYRAVSAVYPSISRATVYRVLNELAADGRISRIHVPKGADHYDFRCHPHRHCCCTVCGQVADVDVTNVPDLLGAVTDPHGFLITGYNLTYEGICPSCREKQENRNDRKEA